jgi:hypothetical protein
MGMTDQIHPAQRRAPGAADGVVAAESVADWKTQEVVDLEGQKLGKLEDVFYDVDSDAPVFVTVKTGGLVGRKLIMVPIAGATVRPDAFRINFRKSEVKDAPTYDPDLELTTDQEAGAYQHYGLAYEESPRGTRRLARR